MMGIGSEADIIFKIDSKGVSLDDLVFRDLSHIGIQDSFDTLGPYLGEFLVGVLNNGVYVSFENGIKLCLDGFVVAVLEAGIIPLIDKTVGFGNLQDISEIRSGGEVELAVHTDILYGAVIICFPYHEHL